MLTGKIKQGDFTPSVLGEQVARILTEAILEGLLKGGDQLVEAELQKQFGISRSPLREAFRTLEKMGLVTIVPRKGSYVRRITRKEIEENFPVRALLEGLAARIAHGRISPRELRAMEKTLQEMDKAVAKNNAKAYWKHHVNFHNIFIQASGNAVLIGILQNLRMHSLWYRFSYQYYQEDLHKSLADHQQILACLQDRGSAPPELMARVQEHIERAYTKFLAYLQAQEAAASGSHPAMP
jgi:DNA-binding GntR family transcriptional regulator